MSNFSEIGTSLEINHPSFPLKVKKFQKKGTSRVFFTPVTKEGKRITKTMFSKLWEAECHSKKWIEYKEGKA